MPTMHPTRSMHAPIVPIAAVLAAAVDWVVFATNLGTGGRGLWVFAALGAFIAMTATVGFQLRQEDPLATAVAKGLVVGLAVAAPMPLLASAVALVALVWEWAARRTAHSH